jgi:hypothetical protein
MQNAGATLLSSRSLRAFIRRYCFGSFASRPRWRLSCRRRRSNHRRSQALKRLLQPARKKKSNRTRKASPARGRPPRAIKRTNYYAPILQLSFENPWPGTSQAAITVREQDHQAVGALRRCGVVAKRITSALSRETLCYRQSDSARRPGHQRHFAVELQIHTLSRCRRWELRFTPRRAFRILHFHYSLDNPPRAE